MVLGWKAVVAVVVMLASTAGSASPRAPVSLADYQHSTWGQREGAPAGIQAMARTSDGWLWLGTTAGLFQFDGLSFRHRETLAPGDLRAHALQGMIATANGDLWVFFSAGGASVLRHGDRDHPVKMTGLPDQATFDGTAADDEARVWVIAGKALYRSNGDRWERVDTAAAGLPPADHPGLTGDRHGNVFYNDGDRFWVRVPGEHRFTPVAGTWPHIETVFHGIDGRVVLAQEDTPGRIVYRRLPLPTQPGALNAYSEADQTMVDSEGILWDVGCVHGQLCRGTLVDGAAADGIDRNDDPWLAAGINPPGTMVLLIDDEGSTWVGTKFGLERFRVAAATRVRLPPDTYYVGVFEADGSTYATSDSRNGLDSDRIWRIDGGSPVPVSADHHPVSALWGERDGSVLLGGARAWWTFRQGQASEIALPLPLPWTGKRPQAAARDARGRLWIANATGGAMRQDAGRWQPGGGVAGFPDGPVATIVPSGDALWFGLRDNRIALLGADDSVRVFDAKAGLATGSVNVVLAATPTLVGGERALQGFDGKAFHTLHAERADVLTGITGILRDADGSLWVNGFAGLARFAASDVARASTDPTFAMPCRLYDDGDGLAGTAQQVRPLPTLTRTGDGRIWVASVNGLAWIEPSALARNTRAPQVAIRDLNGAAPGKGHLRVPAGTDAVRIGFDVLSLARPDRTDVRYRLRGTDGAWIDAGWRREALFDRLPPGRYRFEVIAGNEDGVWNRQGASLEFTVEPRFYQTIWFKAVCVLLALGLAWLLFVLRLRHERSLMRQRMAVRHAERERIARELHDTLLQGISGLLMRLQVWTGRGDVPADVHGDMERAGSQARQMLVQGRDRIAELRADDAQPVVLADELRMIGESLAALYTARFQVLDEAPGLSLRHDVAAEVSAIVHEAMANAHAHAMARGITLTLSTKGGRLSVSVADDGRGVSAEALEAAAGAGHWGVVGMRERARRIGATLVIESHAGVGTMVTIEGIPLSGRSTPSRSIP